MLKRDIRNYQSKNVLSEKVSNDERIIFIVGNPRSGTTMMGHILGQNKYIHTFRELHFFEKLWTSEYEKKKIDLKEAFNLTASLIAIDRNGFLRRKDIEPFDETARKVISNIEKKKCFPSDVYRNFLHYFTKKNKKKISCEQTPGYLFFIDEIKTIFPNSKFIFMVRDPRDVILSKKNRWKRRFLGVNDTPLDDNIRTYINYSPIFTSYLWNAAAKHADKYINGNNFLVVRFEDVLKDPKGIIRKVAKFVDVSFSPDMLKVPLSGSSLVKDNMNYMGIDGNRTQNWKKGGLDKAEIYICQIMTKHFMRKFNYRIQHVFPKPLNVFFHIIFAPAKLLLSLFFHKRLFNNISEPIKRRLGMSTKQN